MRILRDRHSTFILAFILLYQIETPTYLNILMLLETGMKYLNSLTFARTRLRQRTQMYQFTI